MQLLLDYFFICMINWCRRLSNTFKRGYLFVSSIQYCFSRIFYADLGIFAFLILFLRHSHKQVKMIKLIFVKVIPFCGKDDEWPIWSEKFLAKAKRYGFKDYQFMIHVLYNLTSDYDLHLALMERRVGDKEIPLTV
jgi:hypothetical protein